MFVPFQVVALPLAIFMSKLNLSNNFGAILVYLTYAMIMGVYLCAGYMKTIPNELAESYIDGPPTGPAFLQGDLPLMKAYDRHHRYHQFPLDLERIPHRPGAAEQVPGHADPDPLYLPVQGPVFLQLQPDVRHRTHVHHPITIVYCALQKHIVAGLTGGAIKNWRHCFPAPP